MSSTKFCSEEKIWRGPSKPAWLFNEKANLGRILLSILNRNPQKVAQISDNNGIRMTNREIASDAEKIAAGLKQRGCRTGDVVGFVARNGHNITPTLIACFLIEAPTNAMDIMQDENEIYNIFNITKPKFIFCDDEKVNLVRKVVERLQNNPTVIVYGNKVADFVHIEDFMQEGDNQELIQQIHLESCRPMELDYNIICCSSGTTGPQKAVCIPYQSLIDEYWHQSVVSSATDSLFSFCPMFWTIGYLVFVRSIFYGITRITTTETFSPELFLHIVNKYKVTNIIISPIFLDHVFESSKFAPSSLSSLKQIWCGGNTVTDELIKKLKVHLPRVDLVIGYGSTETGGLSCYKFDPKGSISVGNLNPGIEGIVIDENGKKLGPDEVGELCFTAPYSFTGYLNNVEATKAFVTNDGFMHTGDMGFYDKDGFLYIVGRCKDVIKYFMAHVSGSEIERVVKNLHGVSEVAAVGIHDAKCYQLPAAVVVKKKDSSSVTVEEILNVVAEKLPDSHKLRGGVYFVDKMPATSSGKVKKIEAEKYAEEMFKRLHSDE